jgi:hypothetical protein
VVHKLNITIKVEKMAQPHDDPSIDTGNPVDDDRRKFLAACGKFAVVTPPAVTVLLSTSLTSTAIAQSGGGGGKGGGGGNGDPGHGYGSTPGGEDFLNWLEKLLGNII